jgi:phosphatidylinositol kinase/protein kinase (PI-3  family)
MVQYLLDLKDRNNCNIMIKDDGSIFHVDLAFIFGSSPGGVHFENCPFKFTKEYLDAMGGY